MARVRRSALPVSVALALCLLFAREVEAQNPREAPASGYVFLDERPVDRFLVQRWVSQDSPDVSPSGVCECITVVYQGNRKVLDLGPDVGITTVDSMGDVTGDRQRELVVVNNSAGAHCCETTDIFTVESGSSRSILSITTGNCPGEVIDLDRNGVPDFRTCDDGFAYGFCSFAYSPMPPAVFAYDRRRGGFALATTRFAKYLELHKVEDARREMEANKDDAEISRCLALQPALDLIYTGRMRQGQRLFRQLYRRPDASAVERKAMESVRKSALWAER